MQKKDIKLAPDIDLLISEHTGYLEISIRDNGHGMSKETLSKVFDPFFTTKDVGKGTGLGLSIIKNEILSVHGTISIDSQPDQGTDVKITLPSIVE